MDPRGNRFDSPPEIGSHSIDKVARMPAAQRSALLSRIKAGYVDLPEPEVLEWLQEDHDERKRGEAQLPGGMTHYEKVSAEKRRLAMLTDQKQDPTRFRRFNEPRRAS